MKIEPLGLPSTWKPGYQQLLRSVGTDQQPGFQRESGLTHGCKLSK